MQCDMCGSGGELFRTKIEGTMLNVCARCSKYGSVIEKAAVVPIKQKKVAMPVVEEVEQSVVQGYARIIKNKRESMGLDQQKFAQKINERVSVVSKIETGSLKPSLKLAKKLEKFMNVSLIEEVKTQGTKLVASSEGEVTLGDMVKIRKR